MMGAVEHLIKPEYIFATVENQMHTDEIRRGSSRRVQRRREENAFDFSALCASA